MHFTDGYNCCSDGNTGKLSLCNKATLFRIYKAYHEHANNSNNNMVATRKRYDVLNLHPMRSSNPSQRFLQIAQRNKCSAAWSSLECRPRKTSEQNVEKAQPRKPAVCITLP